MIACRSEPAPLSLVLVTGKSDSKTRPSMASISGVRLRATRAAFRAHRELTVNISSLPRDTGLRYSGGRKRCRRADQVRRVLPGRWGAYLAVRSPSAALTRDLSKQRSILAYSHNCLAAGS